MLLKPHKEFQIQRKRQYELNKHYHYEVDVLIVKRVCHKRFTEFCKRAGSLKSIQEWDICAKEYRIVFKKSAESSLCLPQVELVVDDSLGFTIKVYGWLQPDDHTC